MARYYCHSCTAALGHVKPEIPETLTGTSYQLEKYIKHTAPTGTYPINSVFSDPSYDAYLNHIVTTAVSGSAQIDDRGRTNLLYLAGKEIGATYRAGQLEVPADTVVLVLHDDKWKIHAFPAVSSMFTPASCQKCGAPIFQLS